GQAAPKREQKASAAASDPDDARVTARLAHDRTLRQRVTVQPTAGRDPLGPATGACFPSPRSGMAPVTSADVLEAIHHATGLPLVADFSARLCSLETVTVRDQSLYAALNQLAGEMGFRWQKDPDGWLQFRTVRADP